jgi:ATP-binding cassette subfamily B protein
MTERFSVSGALLVTLFGRLAEEHDGFAERAGAVRNVSVKIAMNGRFFYTSLGLVAALATALVYGVGGLFAIEGALTIGTLTALAGLLAQLYGPLTQLTNLRIDVMNALVSFDRVFEVLDLPPMIADRPDAKPVSGPASVRFEDVSFSYPTADQVRWPAWSRSQTSSIVPTPRCCTMSRSPSKRARPSPWWVARAVGRRPSRT